jgi:hypothetical protein
VLQFRIMKSQKYLHVRRTPLELPLAPFAEGISSGGESQHLSREKSDKDSETKRFVRKEFLRENEVRAEIVTLLIPD